MPTASIIPPRNPLESIRRTSTDHDSIIVAVVLSLRAWNSQRWVSVQPVAAWMTECNLSRRMPSGVATKRVLGAPGGNPFAYTISFVTFPSAESAKTCAQSKGGQEALQHAASISTGGPPQFLLIGDAP